MRDISIAYEVDGSQYELKTFNSLLRITRDKEVIHVQFLNLNEREHKDLLERGMKSLNEIIGHLSEYIIFCETQKPYKDINFSEDEWAKRTDIHSTIYYQFPDGKRYHPSDKIDIIMGEMKGGYPATSLINDYTAFCKNMTYAELKEWEKTRPVKQMTLQELIKSQNEARRQIREMQQKKKEEK